MATVFLYVQNEIQVIFLSLLNLSQLPLETDC